MMRRVLFVDSDPGEARKLKKTLTLICPEWEIEFAMSGEEVLDIMSKSPFDVVVPDIRIQGINGIELLDIVGERYPETVRIIHSETFDPDEVLRSTMAVHQFLMKPCCAETVKNTIERTCKLRDLLRDDKLKKIVAGIKNLPSVPVLYNLIVSELQSAEPSLQKVSHLISQDVSMSAKILQLVNSSFFSLPLKITNPQQAAVFVGTESLKSLVLSIDLFSSISDDAESCGFSLLKMWRHSLRTGRLAADIARGAKAERKVVEEAMLAGMLHDIGKLILLKMPRQYSEVMELVETTGCSFAEAEYVVMGASHSELGAYLLGLWGLPCGVVEAVAFHHNPSKLIEGIVKSNEPVQEDSNKTESKDIDQGLLSVEEKATEFSAVTAVHVANALTMQGNCSSEASFQEIDTSYLKKLGLTDELSGWIELYENTNQLSEINLQF
ncbi:MAG: HDOD domain-containing protein [Candidatus Scalindua sp.]|nr:HDOD domain-containing protein [Candidatus Scalindua sp.]